MVFLSNVSLAYEKVSTDKPLDFRGYLPPKVFFFIFFLFAHTNNYITLHLQFITGNYYRLQKKEIKKKKKKRKDKVHQNTTVYILTIKRRLSALWSSITHPPVCCLYFN